MTVEDYPANYWLAAPSSAPSGSTSPLSSPTPLAQSQSQMQAHRDSTSCALAAFARLTLSRGRRISAAETSEFARLLAANDGQQQNSEELARFVKKLFADKSQRGRRLHNSPVRSSIRGRASISGVTAISASPSRLISDRNESDWLQLADDNDETAKLPRGFKSGWGWNMGASPEVSRGRAAYRRRSSSSAIQRRRAARDSSHSAVRRQVNRNPARCCCGDSSCSDRISRDAVPCCRERSMSPRTRRV
ncbi:uncharacterized protein V2V93DRAFT_367030 [Kockiozyma suomiensis]|uniref:uncharacterized protein n=1 Tax=Kockiozyma suomiensis TaxID=1337062 RepID=UPI0033433D56